MITKETTEEGLLFQSLTKQLIAQIKEIQNFEIFGEVERIEGLSVLVTVNSKKIHIGSRCLLAPDNAATVLGEVIGFDGQFANVMTFFYMDALHPKCKVIFLEKDATIFPSINWKGRVLNGIGEPIDDKGDLIKGEEECKVASQLIPAHKRARVNERISLGLKAIDTFLTCCKGQRMGIFAGSGVGKSVLLSMLVKFANCDICIVGLVGERGREVRDFIEDTLGEEGLKKTIIVVSTSDEPALMRRQAAYLTLRLAEFFRDQGLNVLCVIDSITRFAMAQREIGLSNHEPPTTKGYTPSVFFELAKLLERAGAGETKHNEYHEEITGYITALFSVLVDGDDHNEPIADAARGILDGHIVLDRNIAQRSRFPAINVLKSASRTVPMCHLEQERDVVKKARKYMSIYDDMADLIRLGAYRKGSDENVDKAILINDDIEEFLSQKPDEHLDLEQSFIELSAIVEKV